MLMRMNWKGRDGFQGSNSSKMVDGGHFRCNSALHRGDAIRNSKKNKQPRCAGRLDYYFLSHPHYISNQNSLDGIRIVFISFDSEEQLQTKCFREFNHSGIHNITVSIIGVVCSFSPYILVSQLNISAIFHLVLSSPDGSSFVCWNPEIRPPPGKNLFSEVILPRYTPQDIPLCNQHFIHIRFRLRINFHQSHL